MIKISETHTESGGTRIRVEGSLVGRWVEELRASCDRVLGLGVPLELDLGELSFADRGGASLLRELARSKVTISGSNPFVSEQMREVVP